MKLHSGQNVFDAARDRIRFLYREFPNVVCAFSGGKDSTVVFHLCLDIATELERLPLRVLWIDQETEWQATVDYVTEIMTHPNVDPLWLQMPMVISCNVSSFQRFNHCWRESDSAKWVHPRHPLSVKVNKYGTDRFHDLFPAILATEYPGQKACLIGGVRCEESYSRSIGLTNGDVYKGVTWGKKFLSGGVQAVFYPIYDWTFRDIWKSICDNNWTYNRLYDEFYRYGVPATAMRVSCLQHECSMKDLMMVQEIEPATWERLVKRLGGANTLKHLKGDSIRCPKDLPPMFKDWAEYAEHIIDNIIQNQKNKDIMRERVRKGSKIFIHEPIRHLFFKNIITGVLLSDWEGVRYDSFRFNPKTGAYMKWRKWIQFGKPAPHSAWLNCSLIPQSEKPAIERAIHANKTT